METQSTKVSAPRGRGGNGTAQPKSTFTTPKGKDVALELLDLGLRPLPINPRRKFPAFEGFEWRQYQHRAPAEAEVVESWTRWPDAEVGIVTGHPGGLCALDIDKLPKDGKPKQLPNPWPGDPDLELPMGCVLQTPSGGKQYLFATPEPPIRCSEGDVAPGVDVRGMGGLTVVHGKGRQIVYGSLADALDTPCPDWLLEAIRAVERKRNGNGQEYPGVDPREVLEGVPEGKRDTTLYRYACRLRGQGLDREEVETLVLQAARHCKPAFPEDEAIAKVESAWKHPPGKAHNGDGQAEFVPELITADALDALVLPEPKWAVEGLLPEGATVLAGRPKIGKSWLALGLAVAVASAEAYFGVNVTGGDVLYLALEDTPRRLQSRARTLRQGKKPSRLTLATKWANVDDGGLDALDKWLTDHPQARLVLIDTFQRIRARRGPNADLYGTDYAAMGALKTLADKHGVALLALHHTRKAEALDPLDAVSGTTGLTGAADTVMVLSRARGEADGKLALAGRDVGEIELALRFTEGAWELLGDAREWAVSESRRKVLGLLREAGPMTPKDMRETLSMNANSFKELLRRMVQDGLLRTEEGKYLVSDPPHPPNPPDTPTPPNPPIGEKGGWVDQELSTHPKGNVGGDGGNDLLGGSGVYDAPEDPTDWPTCAGCQRKVPQVNGAALCRDCEACL